jgi:hypothetical protein
MLASSCGSITFAVASPGDAAVLNGNVLASPCFAPPHSHQIIVKEKFASAAVAYNEAIDQAANDLIVIAHYDMIFPASWISDLAHALEYLDRVDPAWGVLGCAGMTVDSRCWGSIYQHGMGLVGTAVDLPVPVQTLDEIVLIIRKSSGLRFDEYLPHFHLYGADICLRAAKRKMRSYAIPAFCIHNTNHYLVLPKEFYESYRHIRRVWKDALPVQTTCIRVTWSNGCYYIRRLKEARLRWLGRRVLLSPRADDVPRLIGAAYEARRQAADTSALARGQWGCLDG